MALARTNLTLPEELLRQVDELAGPRGRSRYVAEAVSARVKRDQLGNAIRETAGILVGTPGWMSLYEDGADLYICDAVTCEALSDGTDEHLSAVGALLRPLEYVATSPRAAHWAATSRLRRHREGGKLGLGDALIAGVAADLGATVVTRNRPDFERQGIEVLGYQPGAVRPGGGARFDKPKRLMGGSGG